MALRRGRVVIPENGRRQLNSWIESFVAFTEALGSPRIYRKWAAIATIGAALEQKVWIHTTDPIYPNTYVMLVGEPATGKTRTIMKARQFLEGIKEFHIAPTSMTAASLVDFLAGAKRFMANYGKEGPIEYNTAAMFNDDWQGLMGKYDLDLVAALTIFFETWPYRRTRTSMKIDINIPKPQLNILAGTTPSGLFTFMPVEMWGQGFSSRLILVYSNEKKFISDFRQKKRGLPPEMVKDLEVIYKLTGEFKVTEDFMDAADAWGKGEERPKPTHPKLASYLGRRRVYLYKLAMIHRVDQGGELILTKENFEAALAWLTEVEMNMQSVFDEGAQNTDDAAMEEVVEFVRRTNGTGMYEGTVLRKATNVVGVQKAKLVVELLHRMKRLEYKNGKYWARD